MLALRLAAVTALSLVLAAPAPAQPVPQVISLANFSIAPHPIHLAAGQPVTLTFVNRSSGGHDFTAKEFFASSRIVSGAAPGGEIELRGGESKTITLVPAAGTYKARCSHFLHATMGMTSEIVVQ